MSPNPRPPRRTSKTGRHKSKLRPISRKTRRSRKKSQARKRTRLLLFSPTRLRNLTRKRAVSHTISRFRTQLLLKLNNAAIPDTIHQKHRVIAPRWQKLVFRLSNSRRTAFLLIKNHPNDHVCLISRPRKVRAREANRFIRRTIRRAFKIFPELVGTLLKIRGIRTPGLIKIPFRQVRVALR